MYAFGKLDYFTENYGRCSFQSFGCVRGYHVLSNLLAIAGIIFRHKTYAELQNENQWLQI